MWLTRILLGFQAYMYYNALGFLHIGWVLLSFILPYNLTFFVSSVFMIPVYSYEFWMVYLGRIKFVVTHKWYTALGGANFDFQLEHPLLEQVLYFSIVCLFWLMVSCTYLSVSIDQNKYIKSLYFDKILHPKASKKWKFSFFFLRYIHLFVLMAMFINGMKKINCLQNLAYILFFVIFLTFDKVYRKFSIIMVVFICTELLM